MRALLILNPASGRGTGRESCALAAGYLRSRGWEAAIVEASDRSHITAQARAAVSDKVDIVAACGGDGTVGAVAAIVAGTASTFAVLPTGTLNHFAKDMCIPLDIAKAAEVFTTGRIHRVDIGEVNGMRFVNNSSLGLYPNVVRYREAREQIGRGRFLAFAAACALVFRRFRFLRLRLEIDGVVFRRRTPFLFVGNNRYRVEGFSLGTRPCLDEGKLALYLSERAGRAGLLKLALFALFGRLRLHRDFAVMAAQKAVVLTPRKHIRVALDGEVINLRPPLRYSIHPGLLKVIAP